MAYISLKKIISTITPELYFIGDFVTSVQIDKDNNYWVSTLEKGIFQIPSIDIRNVFQNKTLGEPNKVLALAPLNNHLLYSNSAGNIYQINKYNKNHSPFTKLTIPVSTLLLYDSSYVFERNRITTEDNDKLQSSSFYGSYKNRRHTYPKHTTYWL